MPTRFRSTSWRCWTGFPVHRRRRGTGLLLHGALTAALLAPAAFASHSAPVPTSSAGSVWPSASLSTSRTAANAREHVSGWSAVVANAPETRGRERELRGARGAPPASVARRRARRGAGIACSRTGSPPPGMHSVTVYRLPRRAVAVLRLIAAGGPYPFSEDDSVFGNDRGLLPREPRGSYREFTVAPPGARHRGPRRIVASADGQYYYTSDHYARFAWVVCEP